LETFLGERETGDGARRGALGRVEVGGEMGAEAVREARRVAATAGSEGSGAVVED
jgi:hypothetical protein